MNKRCYRCRKYKNIENFIRKNEEFSLCNDCSAIKKIYNDRTKEKRAPVLNKYYKKNINKILTYGKNYRSKNADKIRKIRAANKEKFLIKEVKQRARRSNIEFDLNIKDIKITEHCPYLQIKLVKTGGENSVSIDRIDNTKGYIKNNIIIVSMKSNSMKSNLSLQEIQLINRNYFKIGKEDDFYINIKDDPKYKIKKSTLYKAKRRAQKKNLEFDLNINDIIIPNICPLLEIPLIFDAGRGSLYSPSIDRIDNTKGYIKGNVRIISHKANTSKSNSTKEEYNLLAINLERIMKERGLI